MRTFLPLTTRRQYPRKQALGRGAGEVAGWCKDTIPIDTELTRNLTVIFHHSAPREAGCRGRLVIGQARPGAAIDQASHP